MGYYTKPEYLRYTEIKDVKYSDPHFFLPLEEIYLGSKVLAALPVTHLEENQVKRLRVDSQNFYVAAVSELLREFPIGNLQGLKTLNLMNPYLLVKPSEKKTTKSTEKLLELPPPPASIALRSHISPNSLKRMITMLLMKSSENLSASPMKKISRFLIKTLNSNISGEK